MNTQMTLRELLERTAKTGTERVPGKVTLKESATRIASHEADGFELSVYSCGYALAEAGNRWTVFRVGDCGGYEYEVDEADKELLGDKDYRFKDDYFMDLPWTVRLTMEAMDRLEKNNDAREDRLISEHPDEPGPKGRLYGRYISVEEEVLRNIEREEMLASLTTKQREAYELYFEMGYTLEEAGEILSVSYEAVQKRISGLVNKLKRSF